MTDHPPRDTERWASPDHCPFCGQRLADAGEGFPDHVEESPACSERFEAWLERIRDDVPGEWGG